MEGVFGWGQEAVKSGEKESIWSSKNKSEKNDDDLNHRSKSFEVW